MPTMTSPHTHSRLHHCCSRQHTSSGDGQLKDRDEAATQGECNDVELEQGRPNFERVILNIDGLKCGCCEHGVSRTVSRIPAIKNHQVNIVLAQLEFDLDINRNSVLEVIKRLSATTGYTFQEYVAPAGQVLELIVTDPVYLKRRAGLPHGVDRIELSDREPWRYSHIFSPAGSMRLKTINAKRSVTPARTNTVRSNTTYSLSEDSGPMKMSHPSPRAGQLSPTRFHYDAKIIGARKVFEHYQKFDDNLQLAPPVAHPSLAIGAKQTRRALYVFLPALLLTIPVLVLAWAPVDHENKVHTYIAMGLATIVQIIAWKEFVPDALRSLYYSHTFEMDFLIALSTTTAYVFSVVLCVLKTRGKVLNTGSFFETSTLLVTLILLGRVINELARFRAAKSVSFRSLQIDEALLLEHSETSTALSTDSMTRTIDARLLQYGDHFKVPPHSRVVTDGLVQYGGSEVDESMITGESNPVAKGVDSKVFAGTYNGTGTLVVEVTALTHENSIHKIAALVEDAELTKPKIQALADRVAGWFVPVIAGIGFLVFIIWLFVDKYHIKESWRNASITAVTYSIATLIVSCPCAIGLAVPMVVLTASGVAARFGIIFRDPQKLEVARNVTDVVFDKTGTLTCGFPNIISENYHGLNEINIKGALLTLLKDVKHPISARIYEHLKRYAQLNPDEKIVPLGVSDIRSFPGDGVEGVLTEGNLKIRAGSPDWLLLETGRGEFTVFCVKIGSQLAATYKLIDQPRHTAELVVEQLYKRGVEVHMISGDSQGAVDATAHSLYISKKNTKSRCKPEGKMNYVKDLQKPGKVVMFVGDGTNDSVALKQADVGVHINQGGSDVAKSAADVVLMTTRLHDVLILLDISRAAYRRILLNFAWSACYNVLAILLAAGAFVKIGSQIRIEPQWAGLGELVSVLPVVLVAFQMRGRDYGSRYRAIEYDYLRTVG